MARRPLARNWILVTAISSDQPSSAVSQHEGVYIGPLVATSGFPGSRVLECF